MRLSQQVLARIVGLGIFLFYYFIFSTAYFENIMF